MLLKRTNLKLFGLVLSGVQNKTCRNLLTILTANFWSILF